MSTRRGVRNTERADSIGTSAHPVSRARLKSRVTVRAIEQALAELGIHARLSDIVAKAQALESGIIQSRSRGKRKHVC